MLAELDVTEFKTELPARRTRNATYCFEWPATMPSELAMEDGGALGNAISKKEGKLQRPNDQWEQDFQGLQK